MPTRRDYNRIWRARPDGGRDLIAEEVVDVDITAEVNASNVDAALASAMAALEAARNDLQAAWNDVGSHVAPVNAIATSSGTFASNLIRDNNSRTLASALLVVIRVERDILQAIRALAQNQRRVVRKLRGDFGQDD